jgi:hypothetical protein
VAVRATQVQSVMEAVCRLVGVEPMMVSDFLQPDAPPKTDWCARPP